MNGQTLLTRKDLAVITGLTVDIIRANEKKLGLIPPVKLEWNARGTRYRKEMALAALRKAGILM